MIILQTINDMATCVINWHNDVLMDIDDMMEKANSIDEFNLLSQIRERLNKLPFNADYIINEQALSCVS